jgi:hypothetical protein
MPDIHYIRLARYVTPKHQRDIDAEIQLDSKSAVAPEPGMTSLRMHSWERGSELTGDAVMDLAQLKELRDALNTRIGELEGKL